VVKDQGGALQFQVTDVVLPTPSLPPFSAVKKDLPGLERLLRVDGLAPGKHVLKIDGKTVATATAAAWAAG